MPKRTRKKKKSGAGPVVAVVLAFVIIISLLVYYSAKESAPVVESLVTVNGVPITQEDLDFQYNLLPEAYRAQLTKEEVLDQIINEELVMQEAKRVGITVTPEDVNTEVQRILQSSGLTVQDLQKNLEHFNVTMEEFERLVERQLLIRGYTTRELVTQEPADADLEALYGSTKDQYAVPEQVTVRHILVSSQRDDAAKLAKSIYDDVRAGDDFCALVLNTSDDKGSRETCGEYTFARNYMVKEFEDASFAMQPGDFRLIQSMFGYHIIEKIADLPAHTKAFAEVKDDVRAAYVSLDQSKQYAALISGLRDKATIVFASEEQAPQMDVPAAEPVETQPAGTQATVTVKAAEQPPAETVVEDELACIARNAILYGATWSADTLDAQAQFEGKGLKVIMCDETECQGVDAYPTWRAGTTTLVGRQTIAQLKTATGC